MTTKGGHKISNGGGGGAVAPFCPSLNETLESESIFKGIDLRKYSMCLHESSNPGSSHFRSRTEFQFTNGTRMWVESIQVTVRVGGVHSGDKSGLEPSCKLGLSVNIAHINFVYFLLIRRWSLISSSEL